MKISNFLFLAFLVGIFVSAQKVKELKTDDEKAAYAIGLSLAQNFQSQGFDKDINLDIVMQAMQDKLKNRELLFSEDSIYTFMSGYVPKHLEKVGKINADESRKFLEENKKKSGVKVTASGLQYKIVKEGAGVKPADKDVVSVNYILKNKEGYVIQDSKKLSEGKPIDLLFDGIGVVPGLEEGLKLMSRGSEYIIYIPSDLAYGKGGPAGPDQALIFEVELIDFKPKPEE